MKSPGVRWSSLTLFIEDAWSYQKHNSRAAWKPALLFAEFSVGDASALCPCVMKMSKLPHCQKEYNSLPFLLQNACDWSLLKIFSFKYNSEPRLFSSLLYNHGTNPKDCWSSDQHTIYTQWKCSTSVILVFLVVKVVFMYLTYIHGYDPSPRWKWKIYEVQKARNIEICNYL